MSYLALAIVAAVLISGCVAPDELRDTQQESDVQTQPPQNTQQENSDVVYDYPIECKPYLGFDNYRTEQTFVINTANSSEMYINIEYRGLYKSTDSGKTWSFSGSGIKGWPRADDPKKPCHQLSFDMLIGPKNTDRILLPGGSAPGKMSEPRYQTGGLHCFAWSAHRHARHAEITLRLISYNHVRLLVMRRAVPESVKSGQRTVAELRHAHASRTMALPPQPCEFRVNGVHLIDFRSPARFDSESA